MRRSLVLFVLSSLMLSPVAAVAQVEGTPCMAEPTTEPMTYGQVLTCTISPVGDSDVFQFLAVGTERVAIQVSTLTALREPCIRLISPTSVILWTACAFANSNRIIATLNEPGLHTIQVFESGNDETTDYALVLERLLPASPIATPIGVNATLSDRIDPTGDMDVYSFEASAGSLIEIRATALEALREPCVELIEPDSVQTSACLASTTNAILRELPLSGTYTVLVHERGQDETANYSLTLTCLSGSCSGAQATLTIPATSPWVDTGIDLLAGQEVLTRATADWTPDPLLAQAGPLGHPVPCDLQSPGCPVHANLGALVARIGSDPPFLVGDALVFAAPSSGRLKFMINDDVNLLADNAGSATVYVLYSAPPLEVGPRASSGPVEMLAPAAPNPFVASTDLRFRLAERSPVGLRVYDMAGRLVRALAHAAPLEAGEHLIRWDGRADDGSRSAPGVYFFRLELPGRHDAQRVILLK